MTTTVSRRLSAVTVVLLLLVVGATGCSMGLQSLPLPAPGASAGDYSVTATFGNALNLPDKATVRLAGVEVGTVRSIRSSQSYSAVVTMDIKRGTVIPAGTTAVLRSATPLGDVYVALDRPAQPVNGPALHDGDTITETTSAPTIESLLSRAALLVNGGVFRDLATTINGLGRRLDGNGDQLGALIADSTTLVQSLSARSAQINQTLRQTDDLATTVAAQQPVVDNALKAAGPALGTLSGQTDDVAGLVDRIGDISAKLQQFPSIQEGAKGSLIRDVNELSRGLNDAATDPQVNLDRLNGATSIIAGKIFAGPNASNIEAELAGISLGVVNGPVYPASPVTRLPDATDVANLVGSLTYTLTQLRDRVQGPGR